MKFTLFLIVFLSTRIALSTELDSLYVELESAMAKRDKFDDKKIDSINELKEKLQNNQLSAAQSYQIINQLIASYKSYNFDSTLNYVEQNIENAHKLNNAEFISESKLKLCALLSSSGRHKEAIDILNEINRDHLPESLLELYYTQFRESYINLSYDATLNKNKDIYNIISKHYTDSLILILQHNTISFLALQAEIYRNENQLTKSLEINSQILSKINAGNQSYSIATYNRSEIYRQLNDVENQKKYLILSAISDIQASIKDNASLSNLALLLYNEKDIERANQYINFAMQDAMFFNSNLRFISISNILPLIVDDYQQKINAQKKRLQNYLLIISLLSGVALIAFIYNIRQMHLLKKAKNSLHQANTELTSLNNSLYKANIQLNKLNSQLSESNHIKEHYIANFLSICSNYIQKLDAYRKMVNRHIKAQKVTELHEYTKSNQLIDAELEEFYKNFDNTFLHIYPNFVNELNKLLTKDDRFELKNGELLNTELRIFALIRLGITDSSEIAKLLQYSINTIYNYRARMKNRAEGNRDDFEKLIMQIDANN